MTAITEITRNSNKSANALKTIGQRIRGVGEDGEDASQYVASLQEKFDKLGIEVQIIKSSAGDMESTYNILKGMAEKWDDLTDSERQSLGELAAGKNRITEFNALMSNWATAVEATTTAMNSQGSAAKENERVLDSIQGHLQKLSSAWEQLSQNMIDSDIIKLVVDLGTALLNLANTGVGQFTIKAALAVGVVALLKSGYNALTASVIKYVAVQALANKGITDFTKKANQNKLKDMISNLTTSGNGIKELMTVVVSKGKGLLGLLKSLAKFIGPAGFIVLGLTAVFTIAQKIYDKAQSKTEEQLKRYDEVQKRLKEINEELGKLSPVDITSEKQINKLKEERDLLKEELEILKEQKKEAEEKAKKEASKKVASLTSFTGMDNPLYGKTSAPETKAGTIPKFDTSYEQSIQGGNKALAEAIDKTKNLKEYQTMTIETVGDLIKYYGLLTDEMTAMVRTNRTSTESGQKVVEQQKASRDALIELADNYQKAMNVEGISNVELTKIVSTYKDIMKALYPTNYQINTLNALLSRTDDTTKAFNSELYKLNSTGKLNRETLEELLSEDGYKGLANQIFLTGINLDVIIEKFNELYPVIESNSSAVATTATEFDKLHESVTNLVSELNTLNDALLEQAENGRISIDTALDLIDKGYAAAISFDEQTGALKLNAKAAKELALAKLALQRADITKNIDKTIAALQKEGEAIGIDIDKYVEKLKAMDASELSDNQKQILNLYAEKSAVDSVTKAYNKLGTSGWRTSSSSSSKSTKEWWEKQLDTLKDQYSNSEITIEEYINSLEKLLGKLKKGSDAWKEVNKLLQEQKLSKVESDYKRGVISLDEYIKKLQELIKTYKQGTKAWQDLADKIKEGLLDKAEQEQKDYEDAAKAATSIIDDEIKRLEELKDAKQKANDETEKELELAKLQEALEKARNERTKRVFVEGKGWTYVQDEQAIKEAQEALDEFNKEQETDEIDKQIEALEKYKEAWSNVSSDYEKEQQKLLLAQQFGADAEEQILNKRLEILEEYRKRYLETLKQISDIEKKTAEEILGATTGTSAGTGGGSGTSGQAGLVSSIKAVFGQGRKNNKNDVKALQQALMALGYSLPKYGADGKWGSETLKALKKFQKDNGLKADGVVGKNTKSAFAKKGYANGGVVDYTGYAMVHGSVNYPEVMLNNRQAAKLYSMLSHPAYNRVGNTSNTTQVYNFDKLVLPNVKNANQFLSELKALVNITKNN